MKLTWVTNLHKDSYDNPSPNDREWLSKLIIGLPKATHIYTVEQLQNMDLIGLYRQENDEDEVL